MLARTIAMAVAFLFSVVDSGFAVSAEREPLRARDFVDRLGVNTKFKDVGGLYDLVPGTIDRMRYLGVSSMREGFPARELSPRQLRGYHAFAELGGRFIFGTHNEKPVADIVADIAAFERLHPGSVKAVEGPNELNNWPISYKGLTGAAAGKAYMSDLYAAVRNDPTLSAAGVLVYGTTDFPILVTAADVMNIHPYERHGGPSHELFRQARDETAAAYSVEPTLGPDKRWGITETGYQTWIGPDEYEGVDEETQAEYGLMSLLNAVELGALDVEWYHLQDCWGAPANGQMAFGVFDYKGAPKPLAHAIHNLTALLADPGGDARSFPIRSRPYTMSGNLGQQPFDGVYHLMMQKSDGTHMLAVWREGRLWDPKEHKRVPLSPAITTIVLGEPASKVEVFDLLKGTDPIEVLENSKQIDLMLGSSPLMLRIH